MPTPRKPRSKPETLTSRRLAKLPRCPDLVIEGGVRLLGTFVREQRQTVQPYMALWIEENTGAVRAFRLIIPSQTGDNIIPETLESIEDALLRPAPTPAPVPTAPPVSQPCVPGKFVVADNALAEAARDLLAPLEVPVE